MVPISVPKLGFERGVVVLKFPLICAVGFVLAATPSLAREVYECSFPELANNMGYLPTTVLLAREAGSQTIAVVDPIIQSMEGGPIDVPVAEENSSKLSVSWPLMLQSKMNDYVKVQYRISIQKSSLSASLSGRPQGYSNSFRAQGRCKRM